MFGWGKKKKADAPAAPKSRSLFSTEIDARNLTPEIWEDYMQRSFQQLPGKFKAVDAQGQVTDRITRAVAAPNGQKFAMDAPSIGNPLSMSPAIPAIDFLPPTQTLWYASQGFIGYQLCAMIAQHWLVDKICTVPCRDAMRHGYELVTDDEEEIDQKVLAFIRKRDRKMKIRKQCIEFARKNRMFGIRIALPLVDNNDPDYYLKPFDINKVAPGSYKGIAQIDPYWITPELDFNAAANPASQYFYEPTWWRVNGQRIHRTHLVIIKNGEPADILKPTYLYGGIPVPQKIAERVYAAERTANEGPQLALTKRSTVLKLDVAQALANFQEFVQKMMFWVQTRDNFGAKIVGQDDEIEQFDTSLTDFDSMTMTQYQIACAAGDCRATNLMGESPKGGLGSEGTYDAGCDQQFLESMQEHDMEPLLEMHHLLLMASEVRPKFGKSIPPDWVPEISWNPVDTPSAKEQAEINKTEAETGNLLVNSGAIDGIDERNRLKADKNSGYNGLANREPEIPEEEDGSADGREGHNTPAGEQ